VRHPRTPVAQTADPSTRSSVPPTIGAVTEAMRASWDAAAARFDEEPDHGLRDAQVRHAWTELLTQVLPPLPALVLDIGCGTGTLSVLLAELGYEVLGVDLSPRMLEQAALKAARHRVAVRFELGDAARPEVDGSFDVVLSRHVLWALPGVPAALRRWAALLRRDGLLILVEGFWHTGAGIHADDLLTLVKATFAESRLQSLSAQTPLWGDAVSDQRYLISARRVVPASG